MYKQSDNGVLAYSTQDGVVHTIFQNGTNDAIVSTALQAPLGVRGTVGEWSADGTRLLLSDSSQDLLDVNPWTRTQIAKVDEPFAIVGPSMSPDGTAYAFGSTANGANIYTTADGTTTQVFPGASDGTAWSNDDQLLITKDGEGALRFPDPVATNHATANWSVIFDGVYPLHSTISRDGTKVAYTGFGLEESGPSYDAVLVRADGQDSPGTKVEGNTNSSHENLTTISPDGKKVAFASNRAGDGTWSIYIRDLIANTTTVVPNTKLASGMNFKGLSWQPAMIPNLAQGDISSATEVGSTLYLNEMYDTPTAPVITTWQWQTCVDVDQWDLNGTCTNVSGQTSAGYAVTAGDVGKRFRVIRTVTNGAGTDTDASLITEAIVAPDTTAPGVPTIGTKPSSRSNVASPTFTWTGAEAGGTYRCSLDNAAFALCTSGSTFAVTGDGSHSFRVRQIDASSNAGDPAEYTWTLDTSAPGTPTVTTRPATRTKQTSATVAYTGAEAGGSFECRLGAGSWIACASPVTMSNLSEGDKSLSIRQVDTAGNRSDAETVSWTVDLTAPAAPTITTKPGTLSSATAPTFAWTGAEAGGTYECAIDSGAYSACISGSTFPLTGQGAHSFKVRQVDAAGNAGTAADHEWSLDSTGPAAPTITTDPGTSSRTTAPTFAWTGAEGGGTYECAVDSGTFTTCTSGSTFPITGEGAHSFKVRQVDGLGNAGTPAEHTWTHDTTVPTAPAITTKPPVTSNEAAPTFAWTGAEGGGTYECSLDNGTFTACVSGSTFPVSGEGVHSFRVRQVDAAGNTGLFSAYTWALDTTAPAAPLIIGSHDAVYKRTAEYQFTGEEGASFECRLDAGDWTACTSPSNVSGYTSGAHTFRVRQVDAAGNTSPAAEDAFTAFLDEPTTPVVEPPVATPTPTATATPTPTATPTKPKLTAVIGDTASGTSSGATIAVKDQGVAVGCSITGTVLTSCRVDLFTVAGGTASIAHAAAAKPVLIGTGTYRNADGAKKLEVDVALNATGRALMRKSPRGLKVSVKITGTPVKGEQLEATGVATLVRQRVTATIGGFAVNRATLTTGAKRQLNRLAKQVKGTAVAIRVVGNTDASSDDADYLERLGQRRARVVAAYLRAHGVKAKATLVSAGATQPKASNATAAGRAQNRRVELRIDR
ncbi:OmpA family protein [Solirubrobacter phytolaccae]|uniref:OmpA family protein n=1 Tax=Solirubrobacter phytolaccae TaxID=1404360 RepID=A0A9X3N4P4_9ACTN|nr:OmpA family protein [Solirubrobacter phytolaccae]MDA0179653.1 OmpA family protein [Solirubrobacter phytolaccae]